MKVSKILGLIFILGGIFGFSQAPVSAISQRLVRSVDNVESDTLPTISRNAFFYFLRGNERYGKGDKRGAIENFNQALKLKPDFAEVYYNRGLARAELGDNLGAVEDFNEALLINPGYAAAYNNRGNARRESGDARGAIADYNSWPLQI